MATIELTDASFADMVRDNALVLVDFGASRCGPCHMFGPVFERVSDRHPDAVFGTLDADASPAAARRFGICAIPTLAVFRDGRLVWSRAGVLGESALEDVVVTMRDLDLTAVRAELDGYRRGDAP